jgi:hypothetical protein
MNNIPTAEEFMRTFNTGKTEETPQEYVRDMLIQFAKLHVDAALKAASEEETITAFYEEWNENGLLLDEDDNYEASYKDPVISGGKVFIVDKESILNAYPLENIK